ncbi:hypothetical protein HU200_027384 [Digitaria exilis]|uniref:Kinetochore protein Spc24 n=1 Tax=Digitaria exilis TaxID=1010633 RepID=A0A835BW08_9POAL|nr:hypothetical protein HU200_027384 [Digitaria exilis]
MEADTGNPLAVDEAISFVRDLEGVLRASNDGDASAHTGAGARMLLSACRSDSDDLELQIREYQEKIRSCKEKIDKAKAETIPDDELNALQNKMEEKLQEEKQLLLRDEIDNIDRQRASIEERRDAIKKQKKDLQKAERIISMCVSVTNIMPNFEDQDQISGYIVDKSGKKIEKFEFEKTMPPAEICDRLWKKI